MRRILALLALVCLVADHAVGAELIQNPGARPVIDLDGEWRIIPDPYETGFYSHRFEERSDGYFVNAKARSLSDLVEYDFSKSQELTVPGDWNSQDERLFFTKAPFGTRRISRSTTKLASATSCTSGR
jgi:beta-glucuronidase